MQFKELATSKLLIDKLLNLQDTGKIPHAILFSGSEGSGNLATAMAFAQYILCDNPTDGDSCGECPHCKKSSTLTHPDIFYSFPFITTKDKIFSYAYIEEWRKLLKNTHYPSLKDWQQFLDSQTKQLNIYVSEIRDITKRLSLKSYSGKKKILIMWLPEFLGKEGNMLLKLIEEPPDNTLFFFVTENEKLILTTILSRTQRIYTPKLTIKEISNYLIKQNEELPLEKVNSIALAAKGNMNSAMAMVNEIQEPFFDVYRNWLLACYKGKFSEINSSIDEINSNGRENAINFLTYGLELMRDVFVFSHNSLEQDIPEKEKEFLSNFAKTMEGRSYEDIYRLFNDTIYGVERNGNIKILLTSLSIEINKVLKGKK